MKVRPAGAGMSRCLVQPPASGSGGKRPRRAAESPSARIGEARGEPVEARAARRRRPRGGARSAASPAPGPARTPSRASGASAWAAGSASGRRSRSGRRRSRRSAGRASSARPKIAGSSTAPIGPDRSRRRRGRRPHGRPGSGSCRRRSGCSAASPGTRCRASRVRPLSRMTTWYSSGPSGSSGRRGPVEKRRVDATSPGRWRSARAAGGSSTTSSSVGTIFSIEARTMWMRGRICVRSPLPSLVTITEVPVSATRKLAPVMPTSAARKRSRRMPRASASRLVGSVRSRSRGRWCGRGGSRPRPGPVHMHGGRDDVARRLAAELDDVFAEVGLDRLDAVRLEMIVEADLLGDHRLALGDGAGAGAAADVEDDLPRVVGASRPSGHGRRPRSTRAS